MSINEISAREVAFLLKDKMQIEKGISLDDLQIQKLTYIAFGYYAIFNNKKNLYKDKIEAWQYGPVIPELYFNKCKECYYNDFDNSIQDTIKKVINKYGNYSGLQLVRFTHSKGTPWHSVYEKDKNNEIKKDDIIEYYFKFHKPVIDSIKWLVDTGLYDDLAKM